MHLTVSLMPRARPEEQNASQVSVFVARLISRRNGGAARLGRERRRWVRDDARPEEIGFAEASVVAEPMRQLKDARALRALRPSVAFQNARLEVIRVAPRARREQLVLLIGRCGVDVVTRVPVAAKVPKPRRQRRVAAAGLAAPGNPRVRPLYDGQAADARARAAKRRAALDFREQRALARLEQRQFVIQLLHVHVVRDERGRGGRREDELIRSVGRCGGGRGWGRQ